ncbi:pre-rRNA-processing protein IPI3 [Angomonas deanei]|nr:pre-rRNA-processing protein IPI3 [Angomonas deanei]|eukprot:EPY32361.1 pre-rRNA-processing protein IPI3 [Angomonas deanei]
MLFVSLEGRGALVDVKSSGVIRNYQLQSVYQYGCTFCPMSGTIAVPQLNNCLTMFSTETQQPASRSFTPDPVSCSVCTTDGVFLLCGTVSGLILVWNLMSGQLLRKIKAHQRRITCLSLSFDSSYVASGSEDSLCKLWVLEDLVGFKQKEVHATRVFSGHSLSVNTLTFFHSSPLVATGSSDKTCRIISAITGEQMKLMAVGDPVTSLAIDEDDGVLAIGTSSGFISFNPLTSSAPMGSATVVKPPKDVNPSPVVYLEFTPGATGKLLSASENSIFVEYTKIGQVVREFFPRQKQKTLSCCRVPVLSTAVARQPSVPLAKNPIDIGSDSYTLFLTVAKHVVKKRPRTVEEENEDASTRGRIEETREKIKELSRLKEEVQQKITLLSQKSN